jgi:hypothetical protein
MDDQENARFCHKLILNIIQYVVATYAPLFKHPQNHIYGQQCQNYIRKNQKNIRHARHRSISIQLTRRQKNKTQTIETNQILINTDGCQSRNIFPFQLSQPLM